MAGLTLDAGALIAVERGDRRVWSHLKNAVARGVEVTVPAVVVAQVYRGARSVHVARVLAGAFVEPLSDERAKATGVLCGRAGTSDVVDAAVVAGAALRGDDVITSDVDDLVRLKGFAPGCGRIVGI